MAYDKTWTFSPNNIPVDMSSPQTRSQSFIYWLKNKMKAAGWSVVLASNAASVGATDTWTSQTALTWGTSVGARYWILLKSPEGFVAGPDGTYTGNQSRIYICLALTGSSGGDYSKMSINIYNNVNLNTASASTSVIPSGGYEILGASGATYIWNAIASCHFHWASTAKGGFYAGISMDGIGNMCTLFYCLDLANVGKYGAQDHPYAFVAGLHYSNSGTVSSLSYNTFSAGNSTYAAYCMQESNGNGWPSALYLRDDTNGWLGYGCNTTGDINGNVLWSPLYIYTNTSGHCALLGSLPDIYWHGASGFANGSCAPATGPITHSLINRLWLPTNAALSL